MDNIRTFEIAVKIGESNLNNITYERESYLRAADEFKEKFIDNGNAYIDVEYGNYKKKHPTFCEPPAELIYPGLVKDIRLEEGHIDIEIKDEYLDKYTPDNYCVGFLMHARLSAGVAEIMCINGATFLSKEFLGKTFIV